MSEVRGSGRECQVAMAQEPPRGATPHPKSGWWLGGATLHLRSGRWSGGAVPHTRPGRWPGRATHLQGAVAVLAQEGLEELSHVKGQKVWQ